MQVELFMPPESVSELSAKAGPQAHAPTALGKLQLHVFVIGSNFFWEAYLSIENTLNGNRPSCQ